MTSEYNYAKHLREIILETLSGEDKGEQAYRHYTYDVSCGKFLNTLLFMALRKAKALEKFRSVSSGLAGLPTLTWCAQVGYSN